MQTENSASVQSSSSKGKFFTTKNMVMVGMFAAVLSIISQLQIPMPGGVPITIQVFGIALTGVVLGWKMGFFATIVYILIGAVGLPVFANFRGGFDVIAGMSGGYILAWPVMAFLSGLRPHSENGKIRFILQCVLSLIGLMVVEFVGGLQWALLAGDQTYGAIMIYSFVAFIPKDAVITVLAVIVGNQIRRPLMAAGFLK